MSRPIDWWARGVPDRERAAGRRQPDWARRVDEVLTEAGTDAGRRRPRPDLTAFALPFEPFVRRALGRLRRRVETVVPGAAVEHALIGDAFAEHLRTAIGALAARTLAAELEAARHEGALPGADGRDRFAAFTRRMSVPSRLAELLHSHPVLARLVDQTCRQQGDVWLEMAGRFVADRPAIVAELLGGVDPGGLAEVRFGAGDPHTGGRSVAILRFVSGAAIAYKPRPMAAAAHFAELVAWLNATEPTLRLLVPPVLPREEYGWAVFVPESDCADAAGFAAFYRRQGALLALLYVTDGTDIHFENVVAHGDQPVVVDLETLFHPGLTPRAYTGADPAADALACSVARTALLRTVLLDHNGAVDVSGLGGGPASGSSLSIRRWTGLGTDTPRLVLDRHGTREPGNRPRWQGGRADPAAYRDSLVDGFRAAYRVIVAHRDSVRALLARFAGDPTRVIVRATRRYAELLEESTSPELMRDAQARDRWFWQLREPPAGPVADRLLPDEIAALWSGDVPVFYTTPDSTVVHAPGTATTYATLPISGAAATSAKLERMGEADLRGQEWLIAASFAAGADATDHRGTTPEAARPPGTRSPDGWSPEHAAELAASVADTVNAAAERAGDRAGWLGLEPVDDRWWYVLPVGAGLAHGYCGIALFLAQAGVVLDERGYLDTARRALRPLPALLAGLARRPEAVAAIGPGAFHGIGGICYALARLARLLDDRVLRDRLADAMTLLGTFVDDRSDDVELGLGAGLAGALAAATAVAQEVPSASASALAERLARTLVRRRAGRPVDGGLLHGSAGMAWALRRYTEAAIGAAVRAPGPEAAEPGAPEDTWGWCCGRAGLLAAAPDASVWRPWLGDLRVTGPLAEHSLCHGEAGLIDAVAAHADRDEVAGAVYRARAARLIADLTMRGPRCGTPDGVPTPGLLTGLAGIGYGLLRIAAPEHVPSILALGTDPAPA